MQETRNNCFGSKIRRKYNSNVYFGSRAYLFSPDEGYIFLTRNNCCESLASYDVIIQSVFQSYLKAPVCGAWNECNINVCPIRVLSIFILLVKKFCQGLLCLVCILNLIQITCNSIFFFFKIGSKLKKIILHAFHGTFSYSAL